MAFAGAALANEPGDCANTSRAVGSEDGLIRLATDDAPDAWWGITKRGMEAAGVTTPEQQLALMNFWFTRNDTNISDAIVFLVDQVRDVDVNGNGYVCASQIRGVSWSKQFNDPNFNLYTFYVHDDKLKNRGGRE
jgi:hypothetical protein